MEPDGKPHPGRAEPFPHLRFSTGGERTDLQFEAWRAAMSGSIDVRRPQGDGNRPGFAATLDAWDIAGVGLVAMAMPGDGHAREWDHEPRAEMDHWSLMIPVIDGSGAAYGQRPVSFGSLARPFRGAGSDMKVVSLFLPRDLFAEAAATLDAADPQPADRGAPALLVDFVLSLEQGLAARGAGLGTPEIAAALRTIVLAGLAPTPDRLAEARPLLQARLAERMIHDIRRHLAAPELGWGFLAARFGMSRSAIHRILEPYGGVSALIRAERLRAIRAELERGAPGRPISAVAEHYGFLDASGFSRAFRQAFGCSPTEIVAEARRRTGPAAIPAFDAFLSGLGPARP